MMYVIVDSNSGKLLAVGDTFFTIEGHTTYAIEDNEDIRLNPSSYILTENEMLIKDESYILETAKAGKGKELEDACRESILNGFPYTINGVEYHFSYDYEAQGNFRDAKEALLDGSIPEVRWTVRKDGEIHRVLITKEIIVDLCREAMTQKNDKISRLRDFLMLILEGCTTIEDINQLNW
jgi:hypothetical protein